jgi:hypothetical protein
MGARIGLIEGVRYLRLPNKLMVQWPQTSPPGEQLGALDTAVTARRAV